MAKGDDLLISANEREFILKALTENELRVDGRGGTFHHVILRSKTPIDEAV
jgi:hypothetical protein